MKTNEKISRDLKFKGNPRKITESERTLLRKHIEELGDLSGVVYCHNQKAYVGGNQRTDIFDESAIEIVETYKKPNEQRTIAYGFINYEGERFAYREVQFDKEQFDQACIVANNSGGSNDWDVLDSWDAVKLIEWGLKVPTKKNTELLSGLKYEPLHFEPTEKPEVKLIDCVDLEKFEAKIKALDDYKITKEQKEVLKLFTYRFIKIDFEQVANYYYFNANDEEQKAIERLRLVLTDNGLNGFIEDDLIKLLDMVGDDFKTGSDD
jgi:hypothetical protein